MTMFPIGLPKPPKFPQTGYQAERAFYAELQRQIEKEQRGFWCRSHQIWQKITRPAVRLLGSQKRPPKWEP